MADIILTVDASSLNDAKKKLEDFGKAVNNFSVLGLSRGINSLQSNIRELVNAQRQGTIGSSAYQLGLLEIKRAYEQMGYSSQAATAAVRKYAAELQRQEAARAAEQAARELARAQQEAAAATQRLADRQRELRIRFQDGYALFVRQRAAMRDLREAYRANIITLEQYKAKLEQIRAGNLSGHINQQAQGMSKFGLITQQAGYQIGDFFVQVQSGTNAMVAFGQQATQIIGTFAGLATSAKAILAFSALGILVSIGTAIGSGLMRASGASKTLTERFSDLSQVSSNLHSNFSLLEEQNLETKFGNLTGEVKDLTGAMLELNAASELNALFESLKKSEEQASANWWKKAGLVTLGGLDFGNFFADPADMIAEADESAFSKLGLQMSRSTFLGFTDGMKAAAKAGDRQGVVNIFKEFLEDATDSGTAVSQITEQGALLVNQLYTANLAIAESEALLNGSAEGAKRLLEADKARLEALVLYNQNAAAQSQQQQSLLADAEAIKRNVEEQKNQLNDKLRLSQLELQFGKDSAQYRLEQQAIERRIFMEQQMQSGVLGNNLNDVMAMYDANVLVEEALRNSKAEAELLSGGMSQAAIDALKFADVDLSKGISSALAVAAELAGFMRMTLSDALSLVNLRNSKTYSGRGGDPTEFMGDGEKAYDPNFKPFVFDTSLDNKKRGGGKEDALKKLREQLALENELLGVSDAQKRVLQALGDQRSKYSQDEIRFIIAEVEAYNTKLQALEQQKQIADTLQSSMETAFMSIVSGTESAKDAFKKMAYEMIKELYRVLVVQRMVGQFQSGGGGILGGLFGFLGGGPSTGTLGLPKFASGGSMMPGKPYLVGEQGPEIVVPRHSGTVVNAQQSANAMGNGGGVTVQNNITVTGSDAAMVRAEVAKMIPQITNATKAAVIDARLRGGQMKSAFS